MDQLKMLTTDEVAELMHVHRDTVAMWREVGIIEAIKTGKCFMFSQEEILRVQRDYKGLDISNKVEARESYRIVINSLN